MLRLYKRGKIYHLDGSVAYRNQRIEVRETTGSRSKAEAENVRRDVEQKIIAELKEGASGRGRMLSFTDATYQYLAYAQPGWTDVDCAEELAEFFKGLRVDEITPERWVNLRITKYAHLADVTVNRRRDTCSQILNHIAKTYGCKVAQLPKYKIEDPERVVFLEVEKAHEVLNVYPDEAKGFFTALAYNGLRKNEARLLKKTMVNGNRLTIPKNLTKQSVYRNIPIHPKVQKLMFPVADSDYVFPAPNGDPYYASAGGGSVSRIDYMHSKVRKQCNIPHFRIHDWRHHFASHIMMNGGNLKVLKTLGGWKDTKSVMRYANIGDAHITHTLNKLK